ncbi:DNA-binding protein [Vibrio chagasii]|uniref:PPC domain-containing DNA-binding protein n=1 Tax=Vibrio TaxID=662 RepID=UPI000E3283CF|nr:PPC domain-containing DNA-binding protein [Vibrio splendidus]CAH6799200.1 DNA-binding protein [Vibrio chagasii]CAH6810687.1 DNA-binding protein [Vibrio chagasii]CAH6810716.1 DNA-binding protein [Vibrio chagasii]CAH6819646.1 DNA-binding protein [Vibrio chagasii]CAH6823538.1 DNA-binding protein [Vibrio chagasii]
MITPIATRLTRGQDLKLELQKLVAKHNVAAGSIASCVGCVSQINIRLANANHTKLIQAPFEIVSVMATLTPNHQHVHISVADENGDVIGGHLLEGTIIATTAELILHRYDTLTFSREHDDSTGYTELTIIDNPQ